MSVSTSRLQDPVLREQVVRQYRTLMYTIAEIAAQFHITPPTASAIIHMEVPAEERARIRGANHSRRKMAEANPMFGKKTAAERILRNGRAAVWNGNGYTFEHRLIAAKELGLENLPAHLEVHHIDGDKSNNHPDNLAIATKRGHRYLHKQLFGRLYLWEKEKFGTSLLPEMQATLLKD